MSKARQLSRREFVKASSLAAISVGAGATLGGMSAAHGQAASSGLQMRTLGRTGLKVTDISFGGIQIPDPALLHTAIDKGINLVHTSPGYGKGKSIECFSEVMKTKRDKVVLALKVSPSGGVEQYLKQLHTDHVDVLIPGIHDVAELGHERMRSDFDKLKKEGKILFSGFACHKNHAALMAEATKLGFYDVLMFDYHLGNRAELDPLLAEAKAKQNVGFMVMKAMKGLNRNDPSLVAAGFKKLLENKHVDTLCIGMASVQELERNVAVSGQKLTLGERRMLEAHCATRLAKTCTGCGACSACPRGILVADILRFKMYADERGEHEMAREGYRELPRELTAANCNDCGQCEAACPKRLALRQELHAAHAMLA